MVSIYFIQKTLDFEPEGAVCLKNDMFFQRSLISAKKRSGAEEANVFSGCYVTRTSKHCLEIVN